MTNDNSAVLAWTNVGDDLYNNNIDSKTLRNVSSWFPHDIENETPTNKPQNNLVPKNFPNRNPNNDAFANSVIRVFAGEPQTNPPTINDRKSSQSLIDFFGTGLNAKGPATHSNPARHRPSQSSVNQGSLIDFLGNPFKKPNSKTSPTDHYKPTELKCLYV